MPLRKSPAAPIASEVPPQRRCWTVEPRSSNKVSEIGAGIAAIDRCRQSSLRLSLGEDDEDVRESGRLLLSPCSSPSFSFDSVNDMFAAMTSTTVMNTPKMRCVDEPSSIGHDETTRLQLISPTTKRQKKTTSRFSTRSSSRRYTSFLPRCLRRQSKNTRDEEDHARDVMSEPHDYSFRATERGSIASTSCSAVLTPRGGGRFGTVLLNDDIQDLHLFREEAEYSDYLSAFLTGSHTEMDSVVFYELEVHLSQMKWKLYRRFSEFRALRQDLLKHFSKRLRQQQSASRCEKCEICANLLQTIEQSAFPSRQQTHRRWNKLFSTAGASSSSPSPRHPSMSPSPLSSPSPSGTESTDASTIDGVISDRKGKFADFVSVCLLTVRGLRQHGKVMKDSSACEIGTALRMIEEFLGLSFTRYLRFLSERGVVEDPTANQKKAATTAAAASQTSEAAATAATTKRRFTAAS